MGIEDNTHAPIAKPRKRVFYGWWIVAANAAITFYAAGTFFYGFGAFINPLKQAFGWTTTQISVAFSIRSAESGPIAPLAGYLVDRFGARIVTIFGVAMTGLGFLLLSRINSLPAFYIACLVVALGTSTCLGVTPMTNIGNWFIRKRGRAMGFYTAAAGLSGLMVPVVTWLLHRYDWRTTLVIMAVGMWLVLPLALVLRHRPEKHGLRPDGEEPFPVQETSEPVAAGPVEGFTTRQALKDRSFWMLSLTFLLSMPATNAVVIFLIPYLTDPKEQHGLALVGSMAGASVTIMTLVSLIGRFGFGWLADYHNQRYMLMGLFVMQSAGLLVLASVRGIWQLVFFFLLFAPSYGAIIALRPTILADYFGRRSFGMIQGLTLGVMTIGGVLTPILVGTLRDATGGYSWPFFILSLVVLLAIPLLLLARRPPVPPDSREWRPKREARTLPADHQAGSKPGPL